MQKFFMTLLLGMAATGAIVADQRYDCSGVSSGGPAGKPDSMQSQDQVTVQLRQQEDKAYLSFETEAFIEARREAQAYSFAGVSNVLGTSSMRLDLASGEVQYEALVTRNGVPQAIYTFSGVCSPGS